MPIDSATAKGLAAAAALELLPSSESEVLTVGLGTGSTARLFIDGLGARVKQGRRYRGVPTSQATRAQAEALAIPLLSDDDEWDIVLAVDGADEVDPQLNVIKGGGGALTREKIVNFAARKNILIVDQSKLSVRLGEKWPVPVEVLRFGHRQTARRLGELGHPTLRLAKESGEPFVTDAGNYIYDVAVGPMDAPEVIDRQLGAITGVVETGLFIGRADLVIVAGQDGVRTLRRPGGGA